MAGSSHDKAGGSRKKAGGKRKKAGGTFVCIASGPSLTQEDAEAVEAEDCEIIAVNTSFKIVNRGLVYGCDEQWWKVYHKEVTRPGWTASVDAARKYSLNYVKGTNGSGLCTKKDTIHYGRNSGYQAINLAYQMGAERIILLGYDMQLTGSRLHWHGKHPKGLHDPYSIKRWVKGFSQLASDLENEGVECINATRETALECFPRQKLEQVRWRI